MGDGHEHLHPLLPGWPRRRAVGLAPGGLIAIPTDVNDEVEQRRTLHTGIPSVSGVTWAEVAVLDDEETWTQTLIKAQMGGGPREHLGECAVIACARHRGMVAVLDERAAGVQADLQRVSWRDSLWIAVEAYKKLFGRDRERTEQLVDDLLTSGLWLPFDTGSSVFTWAYEEGLLP